LRFIFDTNVLVSVLLFDGNTPDQALKKGFAIGEVLFSVDMKKELERILNKRKFDHYVPNEDRLLFVKIFSEKVIFAKSMQKFSICRDPKDDMILELAISSQVDYIITGDIDLLVLNPFYKTKIVTPFEFLQENI
jgi:uncharacterized protein